MRKRRDGKKTQEHRNKKEHLSPRGNREDMKVDMSMKTKTENERKNTSQNTCFHANFGATVLVLRNTIGRYIAGIALSASSTAFGWRVLGSMVAGLGLGYLASVSWSHGRRPWPGLPGSLFAGRA